MSHAVVGSLAILTGCAAVAVGVLLATRRLRAARRTRHRSGVLYSRTEDWTAWFLEGFAGVAVGTQWLAGLTLGALWAAAGAGLILLGLRLL